MRRPSKKKTAKTPKAASPSLATGALGCCTLTGSGPDKQIEGIGRAACIQKANELGKNFHWVAGKCAEPS